MTKDERHLGESWSPTRFECFFKAEYPIIRRIAFGIVRDAHLADDVAQDVFVAVQRRFPELDESGRAVAWAKIAVTHLGLNAIRSERRREDRQSRGSKLQLSSGPEELAIDREQAADVRAVLARIPRHSATVLSLRYSGLSYAEVAEVMGVKVGAIGTMLRRAEEQFRKEVDGARR